MSRITLDGIAHAYRGSATTQADYALKPLHHVWEQGMAYALLGPSGCGKTTLLNIISGLIIPSEGRLLFDDKDVTRLPTEKRNIAQVFQFPVIYDTMTVAENLAFPLKNRGLPRAQIEGEHAVGAGAVDHVGDELGGDRRARAGLPVLAGITEIGDHGGDAPCRRAFQRVDQDQQLHQVIVGRR